MSDGYWKITVASWGTLWARGTEQQAEEWRRHKARWEQCVAHKERVSASDLPSTKDWTNLAEVLGGDSDE